MPNRRSPPGRGLRPAASCRPTGNPTLRPDRHQDTVQRQRRSLFPQLIAKLETFLLRAERLHQRIMTAGGNG
jgi:hypothetical protein